MGRCRRLPALFVGVAVALTRCGEPAGPSAGEQPLGEGREAAGPVAPTPGAGAPPDPLAEGEPVPDAVAPQPGAAPVPGSGPPGAPDAGASTAEVDRFGVTQLHPTRPGGEEWLLAEDATSDARFDPQQPITRNPDGSWKMRSAQVRMQVFTSVGYRPTLIQTYERDVLAGRGYMQSPEDWKNVEMTGFFRLNHATDPADNFDLYARGGRHSDPVPCEGSSYKAGLHYDGRVRYGKESWHVSYVYRPYHPAVAPLTGRWVGIKAVMQNTEVQGLPAVKLELWVNDTADRITWHKVYETVDDGTWGGNATACGGSSDGMPITWGGPIATFRWDNAPDVDFQWLSVREIEPLAAPAR